MAFRSSLSRERSRRRRQLMRRGALALGVVAVFVGIGYSSYLSGSLLARLDVIRLQRTIDRRDERLTSLQSENSRLHTDLAEAQQAADALRHRYEADVPAGRLADLVQLVRERLRDNVPHERIEAALREAENTRPCDGRATRKRFAVQLDGQAKEGVSLLDGLIRVSASAPSGAGDLTKAATVTISRVWSAQPIKVTGMPVRRSVTINNAELQLVVEPSDVPGYGAVSLSTCGKD